LSHAWLKVEEGKNERALPSEEKIEGKSKKSESLSRGPCSPFYQTRGHVTLVEREKEGERLCMHDMCRGKLAAWLLVSGPGTMPHACNLAIECFYHLAFAWVNERTQTSREDLQLVGGCMADKHVRSLP
jgi:hypothetical protein